MRPLLSVFLAILLFSSLIPHPSSLVQAEFRSVAYKSTPLVDSLITGETDTLTWYIHERSELFVVQIEFDSVTATGATDSALFWYRNFICDGQPADTVFLKAGGSTETVTVIPSTPGSAVTLLNWIPGYRYTILIDPLPGSCHQLILKGNAGTMPYTVYTREVNQQ